MQGEVLSALRARIGRIEGWRETASRGGRVCDAMGRERVCDATGVLSFDVPAIDGAFRARGLRRAALHELTGNGAAGFVLALLACVVPEARLQDEGRLLWCGLETAAARLYPPGLAGLGFAPERLITVLCRDDRELWWAVEEGLRSGAVAAVIAEPARPLDFTRSRRLQLAAQQGGTAGFFIFDAFGPGTSAAWTRWVVAPLGGSVVSETRFQHDEETMQWRVELVRNRGGRTGVWEVAWYGQTHSFDLVSPAGARPLLAQQAG